MYERSDAYKPISIARMSEITPNFDTICIGSSPICLLEALHTAECGGSALVVDAGPTLGGAWRESSEFGIKRLEIAPHILLFNRDTYDYFAAKLGVRMKRMEPPPRYVIQTGVKAFWLPYALSPLFAYLSAPLHYVSNPKFRTNFALIKEEYFGRLGESARQILQWVFASRKPHIEYPVGGTLELLDRIKEKLHEHGVHIQKKAKVQELEKGANGLVTLRWDGGEATARKVFMTRHQHISKMKAGDTCLEINYLPFSYDSVHLLVRMDRPLKAAFILAKRDPIINLISDITNYTHGVPEGCRLLVVRTHGWTSSRDEAGGAEVFQHLIKKGYLSANARLENAAFSSYQQGRMQPDDISRIEQAFTGSVHVFRSTNFSNSIGAEIPRWKSGKIPAETA